MSARTHYYLLLFLGLLLLSTTAVKAEGVSLQGWAVSTDSNNAANSPPPAPCSEGACSEAISNTHETTTEIVTLILTFTYFNGDLIDVNVSEIRENKAP